MITIALQFGNVDEWSHGNKISPRALVKVKFETPWPWPH